MVVLSTAGVKAASADYELLEPGTYEGYFEDFEMKKGPNGEYARLEFVIDEDDRSAHVWTNLSTSVKSVPFTKRALLTLGVDPDTLEDEDGFELEEVLEEVRSNRVKLRLAIEDYTKKDGTPGRRNEVKAIKPEE